MKVLGIIPARGGSKGVPGKNLLMINGKPLISYAIETGKKSLAINRLIVSTEDDSIAKIAVENDCEVYYRSKDLATDTSNVVDAVLEVIEDLESKNQFFDAVLLLQPTSPLRTEKDVDKVVKLLNENKTDAVISMVAVEDHHPARMYEIIDNRLVSVMPQFETSRRQDLPQHYLRNGCIYLIKINTLKRERSFTPNSKIAYIMDPKWAINIDTPLDVTILKSLIIEWNKINT